MASPNVVDSSQELLDAQAHVWSHIHSYVNSMSLKCALQLGIPDIIHKHDKPMTLSQLAHALSINESKSHGLYRLMRILVHSKFFDMVKISDFESQGQLALETGLDSGPRFSWSDPAENKGEEEREAYSLTRASHLLLTDNPLGFAPLALILTDPIMIDPFHHMSEWLRDECPSPFITKNGVDFWEFGGKHEEWNGRFNEAMAADARFAGSILIKECKQVYEGLKTLVDVAGGTGEVAKALAGAFPGLKCVVLDQPHVVAGMEGSDENVRFVSGDMFEFIPPADAVFLKWIMHDWGDEDCTAILRKCKEAIIRSKKDGGKVIIVDMVVNGEKQEHEATETQLFLDMVLLANFKGFERTEKEWAKLFAAVGFKNYKITPILGLRSVIEVFP